MDELQELLSKFELEQEGKELQAKPRILIIDDDESVRRGLARSLENRYEVIAVETGEKGIEALSEGISCVILDIKMQGLDGFSVYPLLKEKNADVPVIFYTAFQSDHNLQEVINAFKPEGYVEKGRSIDFLEHLVGNAVGKYRIVQENRQYQRNLEKMVEERTLALQREKEKVMQAHHLLSRYVAPQISDRILDGHVEDIWGHHRKKLTLFFSDIRNFTQITDAMEPEEMAALLNTYFSRMVDIVNDHGGTLANIIGDGLFVFFGAPEATSDRDHAVRCVTMAVTMQREMGILQARWFEEGFELPLTIRCGINTGMVTVGGFGSKLRREYTAMGLHVNLASRLESACEPGQILISHSTWAMVKEAVRCEPKEDVQPKGFSRPVKTYRVCYETDGGS